MQRKISIDTQSPVPILKAIKSAEEDEYRYWMCEYWYLKLLKAQWMWSTSTEKCVPVLVLEIQLGVSESMIFVQGHGHFLFPRSCS